MAENSETLAPKGKRRTKHELSAADWLEIIQQAVISGKAAGLDIGVKQLHGTTAAVAIVISGVEIKDGRIVATTGTEAQG